jgi:hypothetical protein
MLTEALIGAVTEAVIERVANIAGLEDRLRQWLRRDPARLAFAKAFTRASHCSTPAHHGDAPATPPTAIAHSPQSIRESLIFSCLTVAPQPCYIQHLLRCTGASISHERTMERCQDFLVSLATT